MSIATDRKDIDPAHPNRQWLEGGITGYPVGNSMTTKAVQLRFDSQSPTLPNLPNIVMPIGEFFEIDMANGPHWYWTDTKTLLVDETSFQPNLPEDTQFIITSGLDIITNQDAEQADFDVTFCAPSSQIGDARMAQVLAAKVRNAAQVSIGAVSGIRSGSPTQVINLEDMKFKMKVRTRTVVGLAFSLHLRVLEYSRQNTLYAAPS